MIAIRGLRVVFGRTVALDGVSLDLRPGVTGVFGPNASGKSTLLRVVTGLLRPHRGSIVIDGAELTSANEGLRRRIGYAGHDAGLYARLTVRENLELFARLYGVSASNGMSMLEQLDVADRTDSAVWELSAGLKRRVAIARALLHDPDFLLLDEPYANLDDDASERVTAAVKRWRRPNKTALIATHGAKRLKPYADASLVLRRGAVASYRTSAMEPAGSATS